MHESRPIHGELGDVYLDKARRSLRKFYINHRVRAERRRIWLAAVTIQKEYRKRDFRKCVGQGGGRRRRRRMRWWWWW
jgi:hypothetical protein